MVLEFVCSRRLMTHRRIVGSLILLGSLACSVQNAEEPGRRAGEARPAESAAAESAVEDFFPLLAPIFVTERDLAQLRVGQTARVRLEVFPIRSSTESSERSTRR